MTTFNISSRCPVPRDFSDLDFISEALFSGVELSGSSVVVKKYEEALAKFFNVKEAIALSSGTAAIHCALYSIGVEKGDEVLIPCTGAVMSAMPVLFLGAKPVFVDVLSESFKLDLNDMVNKITKKTKCIMTVPMWGCSSFDEELKKIAELYNLPIIEDAAQAIGSRTGDRYEGTFGICGCFSTHELKLISTGEGGFVLTNDSCLAKKIREFSRIGLVSHPSKIKSKMKREFGIQRGLNYKLSALNAALGMSQLNKLKRKLAVRHFHAEMWVEAFRNHELLQPFSFDKEYQSNYYGCVFLLSKEIKCDNKKLAEFLNDQGLSTDIFRYNYKLLPEYKVFSEFQQLQNGDYLENGKDLCSRILVFPTHEYLTKHHIEHFAPIVLEGIRKFKVSRTLRC